MAPMSIYERGGVWWARFSVNGQRYWKSLETGDRREAFSKEKEAIAKAGEGKLIVPGTPFPRLGFSEAVDQYISERKARVSEKTYVTEIERGKAVKAKFGGMPLKKISAETVMAYMRGRKHAG